MANVNQVALSGRAYSKRTNQVGETMVVNFVIRQFIGTHNGEEIVDFIPVEAWGKLAEHIDKKFEEGMIVAVNGKVKAKKNYENKTYLVIKVQDFDGFSFNSNNSE